MAIRRARHRALGVLFALGLGAVSAGQTARVADWADRASFHCETVANVVYRTASGMDLKVDLYLPARTAPVPAVLLIHGGGWVEGHKEEELTGALPYLALGYAIVNVQYRLAKSALAPAAVEDCRCALYWVLDHAAEYKLDPARVVVTGSSAGGHLALTTGMLPPSSEFDRTCPRPEAYRWTGGKDPANPKVAAIVNWFGITDVVDLLDGPNMKTYAVAWLGSMSNRDDVARRVSPLSYVRAGLPPVITIHGDADPTVPYSHAVRLREALDKAGVPNQLVTVPGGRHGGFSRDDTLKAYAAIYAFLEKHKLK